MSEYPRALHQPPTGRARWIHEGDVDHPLQYLAWGTRTYGRQPIPLSQHAGWTYQLLSEGRALLNGSDGPVPISAGTLALVGPQCPSGWSAQHSDDRCKILTWIWREEPIIESIRPPKDGWKTLRLNPASVKELAALHRETRVEVTQSDAVTVLAIKTIQNRLDILLARLQTKAAPPASAGQRVKYALAWLKEHPEELSPVSRLCDLLQISPASLNRLFQQHLKKNVREVAYELRMTVARKSLNETPVSVKELALKLGYRHTNDFSRAYAHHWGHPPSAEKKHSDGR